MFDARNVPIIRSGFTGYGGQYTFAGSVEGTVQHGAQTLRTRGGPLTSHADRPHESVHHTMQNLRDIMSKVSMVMATTLRSSIPFRPSKLQ